MRLEFKDLKCKMILLDRKGYLPQVRAITLGAVVLDYGDYTTIMDKETFDNYPWRRYKKEEDSNGL